MGEKQQTEGMQEQIKHHGVISVELAVLLVCVLTVKSWWP